VTNGTRIVGRAEELVCSGITAIGISVDPPAAHDHYRGVGSFALCRTVIDELRDAKARLGSGTPLIEIFTTVYDSTYAHLIEWADELRTWPIDMLRLQHQIWLRTAQRPVSETLIANACGDATFFRSDVDTYCSDVMPDVDAAARAPTSASARDPLSVQSRAPSAAPVHDDRVLSKSDFRRVTERPCTLISNYAFVDPRGRLRPCLTPTWACFRRAVSRGLNGEKFRAFRSCCASTNAAACERCPARAIESRS
jgi:hypothetical protein